MMQQCEHCDACQLSSMNSTNKTSLFVRFLILCDFVFVLLVIVRFLFYSVNMCDCRKIHLHRSAQLKLIS